MIFLRGELAGYRCDQLLRHLALRGLDLDRLLGDVQLLDRADLIGPVERGEKHRFGERVERGQLLAILEHDLADGRLALVGQDLAQQLEGLAPDRIGLQVVGLLDELDPLALAAGINEHLDLNGAHRLEGNRLHLLVGEDDVAALAPFIAAHRLRARDDLVVHRAVDLHLDPAQILLVEQVEADGAAFGRQVELDRNRHQPELDRPPPHRTCHCRPRCCDLAARPWGRAGRPSYTRSATIPLAQP